MINTTIALGRKRAIPFTIDLKVGLKNAIDQFRLDNDALENMTDYQLKTVNNIPYKSLKDYTPLLTDFCYLIRTWLQSTDVGVADRLYLYQDRFFVVGDQPLTPAKQKKVFKDIAVDDTLQFTINQRVHIVYLLEQSFVPPELPSKTLQNDSKVNISTVEQTHLDDARALLKDTKADVEQLRTTLKQILSDYDETHAQLTTCQENYDDLASLVKNQAVANLALSEKNAQLTNEQISSASQVEKLRAYLIKYYSSYLTDPFERERLVFEWLNQVADTNSVFNRLTHHNAENQLKLIHILTDWSWK